MVCNSNCERRGHWCYQNDVWCNRPSFIVKVPREMLLPSVNQHLQTTVSIRLPMRKPPTSGYLRDFFPQTPEPDWNLCPNVKGSMACVRCVFYPDVCPKQPGQVAVGLSEKPKVKIVGLESEKLDWRDRLPEIFSEITWQGVDW